MSDYDQIETIFSGSWKHDRDENLEAFMETIEATDDAKKVANLKPKLNFKRKGDSIQQKSIFGPWIEFATTLKLNEVLDLKDKEENPKYHVKNLVTFEDGAIIQDISPQTVGRRHFMKMHVQGDELFVMGVSSPRDDCAERNRGYAEVPLSTVIPRVGNAHLQQNPRLDASSCTTPPKN